MKRKLFSTLLCAFALLLLMGAGTAPEQTATMLAEEESAVPISTALETDTQSTDEVSEENEETPPAETTETPEQEENIDKSLLIDGEYAPADLGRTLRDGVTYVALAPMAKALDETAQISWDGSNGVVTITTERLKLTAKVGQLYLEANGRYLYLPEKVQMVNERVTVPLWAVAKAFDVTVGWNGATGTITLTRNSGAIQSGDSYYDSDSLFWLSRLIDAESGNQPLEGKMAVGNVVMNRVASSVFPNTVKGVISQKNQFSVYKSGKLANRTPRAESVIAAKLVLDGGEVEEAQGALYFDSSTKSWAAKHKECIATIGGHKFYR